MSTYSEKYTSYPNGFYGFDVTYPWSDPSTPAPYYQSYPTTGEASIDPSIFQIIRRNDEWSFGANLSFLTNSPDGVSSVSPSWEVVQNRYRKNVDTLAKINAHRQMCPLDSTFESTGFYTSQYSPDQISYSIDYGQFFLRDWDYNNLVLLPKFWFVYMDGSTYRSVTGYYNDVKPYADQYGGYVASIDIFPYYGGVNTGSENSRQNTFPFAPYIQFAGTIPRLRRGDFYSGGRAYNIFKDNYVSGVFLTTPYSSGSHILHLFESPNLDNRNNQFVTGVQGKTAIIPFSANLLVRLENMPQYDIKYGLALDDTVTIMDRFGYNWAKSLNAASYSKTGSWCTDPDLRCSIIDPETNEVSTEVLEGVYISDYAINNPDSNYNWGSGDPEFDGKTMIQVAENTNPVQSTTEPTEEIDLNEPVLATTGGNSAWILNQQKIDEFFLWLWNPDGSIFEDIVHACALLGENPMDSVVSLKVYPFDLSSLQRENRIICFGRKASPVNASLLTGSNLVNIDLGSFYFNDSGMFNDFRDYEPYSDYSLYIPFVGVIPLQAVECINTTISVKMIVDLVVGACTAVIFTNGVPYKYIDGQIGIDMPVTGRNLAAYGQTILAGALAGIPVSGKVAGAMSSSDVGAKVATGSVNALGRGAMNIASGMGLGSSPAVGLADAGMNFATGAANAAVGGLGLGVIGAIGASPIIAGAAIPALLNNPQPQTAGCNAPATGLSKPLYPYFIVRRSDCWIPDNYNKLYGRPVQQGGKISDFHGFCKFGNLCLDGIDATEVEKTMINDILQNGVII